MSTIIGSKPVNKCKNRFLNIVVCELEICRCLRIYDSLSHCEIMISYR